MYIISLLFVFSVLAAPVYSYKAGSQTVIVDSIEKLPVAYRQQARQKSQISKDAVISLDPPKSLFRRIKDSVQNIEVVQQAQEKAVKYYQAKQQEKQKQKPRTESSGVAKKLKNMQDQLKQHNQQLEKALNEN